MGRSRHRRILTPLAVALSAALVLWAAPAALGAPEVAQEEAPEGRTPEGKIRVLEPLPINEQLKRTVLDDRLFYAAEPPAAAPPEAEPPEAAPPDADGVFEMVESWARAWSDQDADRYLSFYSRELEVPGDVSRQAWESYRRQRISQPESIEVEVSSFQGSVDPGSGRFRLAFRQAYTSDTYSDVMLKTFELVREDGGWKIVREESREWP